MKVKVEEKAKVDEELIYPLLMESKVTNSIVLMFSYGNGIKIYGDEKKYGVGALDNTWVMDNFTPFKGKITLEND